MSVAQFEGQRREMIAAIRVIAEHLVAEIGKTTLDDRVLRAMAKVPRHEFVPFEVSIRLPEQATADFRQDDLAAAHGCSDDGLARRQT